MTDIGKSIIVIMLRLCAQRCH